jgi:hypothetical protein
MPLKNGDIAVITEKSRFDELFGDKFGRVGQTVRVLSNQQRESENIWVKFLSPLPGQTKDGTNEWDVGINASRVRKL